MRHFIADGLRVPTSSLVLYECWGGPRLQDELRDQAALLPRTEAFAFDMA
jgi:hypothetical protein